MGTKFKLLFTATMLLLLLGVATIINVSLNFREYSIKGAVEKAKMTAAIVKDGLTAHMVNGIMDKRQYFLDQISTNNSEVKSLWLVRSKKVVDQYGQGFNNETMRDVIDKQALSSGKTIQKVQETTEDITLRISIPYKATASNPNCLSCHNVAVGDTLGIISMEFDITNMRNSGLMTILKILALNLAFIVITLLLINYYVSPYLKLFASMRDGITKAYRGDFTHKFYTNIKGDAHDIARRLNVLFEKMQQTFGNIKYNLATFIPQGCTSSIDPLQEAKIIIEELSDIYKFKKTIELDPDKETIYDRFIDVLHNKFEAESFALYEIQNTKNERTLIYATKNKGMCNKSADTDTSLCRAYRTQTDVISTEFNNICKVCNKNDAEYICIPFTINDDYSLIINIGLKNTTEVNKFNAHLPSISKYLEAAKPVVESKILTAQLRENSLKDGMTGLYNRRFLEEFIDKIASQAKRENETYSIMMLDVDFFKQVNDTYGHDVGDKVIIAIGKVLQNNVRGSDLAIRYGGEEFLVMLHNATKEGTLKVANAIHKEFASIVFDVGYGEKIQKTMSIGIARFPEDSDTIWHTIKLADNALYVAKTTGRNKIVEYTQEMSTDENLR